MILAHKIQLDPTYAQARDFRRACGVARYTWNWALEQMQEAYKETGKSPKISDLKKRWNQEKPDWVYESPKDANQQPFTNLQKAYTSFFAKRAKLPTFKSKHKNRSSFYISNDKFRVEGKKVRLPKIGWVRLTEELRFEGKIIAANVSERAGRWYISIQVDTPPKPQGNPGKEILGIDFGLKTFMTLSTGEKIEAPLPLKKGLKLLKRRSKQHSRKKKGGKNREKSRQRLARTHKRIADQRQDFIHKTTSKLVARTKLIVIEDLTLSGMEKLWGRKVSDLGISETCRQLAYKCQASDTGLIQADRWYPSTQLCCCCGGRQKLELDERTYACPDCGNTADRDQNAAMNLKQIYTGGLPGINAWGHEGSDYKHSFVVKPSWMNQELNPCTPCTH